MKRTANHGCSLSGCMSVTVGMLAFGLLGECQAGHGFLKRGVSRGYAVGVVASPSPVAVMYQTAPAVQYSVQSVPVAQSVMMVPVQQVPSLSLIQSQVAYTQPQVSYTVAASPAMQYVVATSNPATLQAQTRLQSAGGSPGAWDLFTAPAGGENLALEADDDVILLRSDPQYLLLTSRMGGEFQVRALKNELRARLARELRKGRDALRGVNWPKLMFRVARTFFFSTYGGDIPADLFGLIRRLIVDVLREEGIDAQAQPGGGADDGSLPFDGQGEDTATGRRYRIQGTIELIGEGGGGSGGQSDVAPVRPIVNPVDDTDPDRADPAARPRR